MGLDSQEGTVGTCYFWVRTLCDGDVISCLLDFACLQTRPCFWNNHYRLWYIYNANPWYDLKSFPQQLNFRKKKKESGGKLRSMHLVWKCSWPGQSAFFKSVTTPVVTSKIPRRVARKASGDSIMLCKWETAWFSSPRRPPSSNCDHLECSQEPGREQAGCWADKPVHSSQLYWASTLAECYVRLGERGSEWVRDIPALTECPVGPQSPSQLFIAKFCKPQLSLPIYISEASPTKVDWNQQIRRLLETERSTRGL